MLRAVSQAPTDEYCMIPLTDIPRVVKFIDTENSAAVARGWGRWGDEKLVFNGCRVSVWEDKKFLEVDSADSCKNNVNVLNATELHT